jgi:hypothetical protein
MADHCFASTAKATIKPRKAKKKKTIAVIQVDPVQGTAFRLARSQSSQSTDA